MTSHFPEQSEGSRYHPMIADARIAQMIELGSLPPRTSIAKFLGELGLILMLCVSVLAPGLTLTPTLPQFRTETLMLAVYWAVFAWLLLAGLAKPIRFHSFYVIGFLFALSVAISLIYGTRILNHELVLRDFYEIPKCWMPVWFFTIAYEAELSEKGLRSLLDYFAVAIVLVSLYGWAQFLNLEIAARLNAYYTDFGHNYEGLIRYNRIFSTMANPNALGQLMSWTLGIYLLAFLFGVGSRARNVGISLMCVVTVALTSSRYGLLASALGLLIVMWLSMSAKRRGAKLIGLVVVIAILVPVFVRAAQSSYWGANRLRQLNNPLQVDSLRGRLDVLWVDAADSFLSSPWVGHGPAKTFFAFIFTDSEYLNILKFYGVVGFIVYLAYYLWPLKEIFKGLRRLSSLDPRLEECLAANLLVIRAGFAIFCVALFMNIGEFTFYNAFLLGFLWMWGGLAVRAAHFVTEVEAQESIFSVSIEPRFVYTQLPRRPALRLAREGFDSFHE